MVNLSDNVRLLAGPRVPIERAAITQALEWAARLGDDLTDMVLMPDLHVGAGIPVGVAARLRTLVPEIIGRDIGCGMRLLVVPGVTAETVVEHERALAQRLRAIFFAGERALATSPRQRAALLQHGLLGLLETATDNAGRGLWALFDAREQERDLGRTHADGSLLADGVFDGYAKYVRGSDRVAQPDPQLGSLGGGNHMAEICVVHRIADPLAAAWGALPGTVAVLVHSGSLAIGGAAATVQAMHNASNFAYGNRLFLGLMVVRALQEACGVELASRLVYDAPHNFIEPDEDQWLHRKGATPAEAERPVIIPGSMGDGSWLCAGHGSADALRSTNHGAGRVLSRGRAARTPDARLDALRVVTPIDPSVVHRADILREHRRRLQEEAPGAYKPLEPLLDAVERAGAARRVAHLHPLVTVKG